LVDLARSSRSCGHCVLWEAESAEFRPWIRHHKAPSIKSLKAATKRERAFDERAFDERAFDERALDDRAFDERAFDERAFDERAFDERAFDERAFDERAILTLDTDVDVVLRLLRFTSIFVGFREGAIIILC
jgi:hypothetical protein